MNVFRRLSSRGLAALVAAIAAVGAVAAAVAVTAFGGSATTPPPVSLAQAVHDALAAPPVAGVTARVSFADRLLGSGALGSLGGSSSPLLSGASGRLWLTGDGHFRLELQSDAGDAQIVFDGTKLTVYDYSSNTAYTMSLPARPATTTPDQAPSLSQIDTALTRLAAFANVSGATPDSVAGQPAYTVKVTPRTNGGLVGGAELSFDAANGVPLHVALYATGSSSPVLDLTVTDVSFGPVPASDVDVSPPAGAKVVTLPAPSGGSSAKTTPVTGLAAVAAAVPFKLNAPDTLDGLARGGVRLIGSSSDPGALVTYGAGLGTVAVVEHAAAAKSSGPLGLLPSVPVGGSTGHELVTALGTVLTFDSGGISYVVGGSVTRAAAESAARALAP